MKNDIIEVITKDNPKFKVNIKEIAFLTPYPDSCDIGLYNGKMIKAENRLDKKYKTEEKDAKKSIRQLFNNPFISKY